MVRISPFQVIFSLFYHNFGAFVNMSKPILLNNSGLLYLFPLFGLSGNIGLLDNLGLLDKPYR